MTIWAPAGGGKEGKKWQVTSSAFEMNYVFCVNSFNYLTQSEITSQHREILLMPVDKLLPKAQSHYKVDNTIIKISLCIGTQYI